MFPDTSPTPLDVGGSELGILDLALPMHREASRQCVHERMPRSTAQTRPGFRVASVVRVAREDRTAQSCNRKRHWLPFHVPRQQTIPHIDTQSNPIPIESTHPYALWGVSPSG